jgi:hypothetical protein
VKSGRTHLLLDLIRFHWGCKTAAIIGIRKALECNPAAESFSTIDSSVVVQTKDYGFSFAILLFARRS